jgi:hypothetical protein
MATRRERRAAAQARAQVRAWRQRGILCPSCGQAPQRAPQRYCEACLVARGYELMQPIDGPWADLVRAVRESQGLQPDIEQHLAARAWQARQAARTATRQRQVRKWLKQRMRLPPPLVRAVCESILWRDIKPDERPDPLPRQRPVRSPLPHQRKWKRQFWTGRVKKPTD